MHKAKRFPFTEQENRVIRESVKRMGENWDAIAKKLPGRSSKQIHDRYINYLRDGLKNEPWTKQEDEILVKLYKVIGPKWTKMMSSLPGRSGNDIKNRWHKHLIKENNNSIAEKNESSPESLFDDHDFSQSTEDKKNNDDFDIDILSQEMRLISTKNNFNTQFSSFVNSQKNSFDKNEAIFEQNMQFELQNFNSEKSFAKDKLKNNINSNINYFEQFNNNENFQTDQQHQPVKLINKIDISGNSPTIYDLFNPNRVFDVNPSICKPDFELQEFFEEISSQNCEFLWY